jgi:thioredoxin reductase (NADPH)
LPQIGHRLVVSEASTVISAEGLRPGPFGFGNRLFEFFFRSINLKNHKTGQESKRDAAGVFFAIGHKPNTDFLGGQLKTNPQGYLVVEPGTSRTSVEGVFASGDVQDPVYRQAITAAGSGCMAAMDAERWLAEHEIH